MPTHPSSPSSRGTQPLVSYIIPAYNLPTEMLRECLDSILRLSLTQEEREIILVDDGSAESPLPSLSDLANEIVYIRQPNRGLSAARNMGLRVCQGRYVQFVDGDDMLLQSGYEHCLDFIRFQQADLILFQTTSRKPAERAIYTDKGPVSGSDYLRHNNVRASACGYLFRHTLLSTLRFHEGILHEDEEFTPQLLLRAEQVYETDATAYYYRKRNGSIMERRDNRWKMRRLDDLLSVIDTLSEQLDRLPADDRAALQRRVDQLTMDYLYNVIVLTHSRHYLDRALLRLRRRGLFPMAKRKYTRKYKIFSLLINSQAGRRLLLHTIPLFTK